MLKDIIVKKAKDILGSLDTKVVGSNKSKANLPIIDRIKKYYLELAIDTYKDEIDKLEEEKVEINESLDAYKNDFEQQLNVPNNEVALKELDKNIKLEEKNKANNEVYLTVAKEEVEKKQAKLDELNAKIEENQNVIEPIKNDVEVDKVSENLEKEANKVIESTEADIKVEEELKNTEEELKNTVNSFNEPTEEKVENHVEKSQVEVAKDNMIDVVNQLTSGLNEEVKTTIEKTSEDLINSFTTFFQNISVAYESKLDEQAKSYEEKLKVQKENDKAALNQYAEKSQSILAAAEKDSKEKSAKINELTNTNNTIVSKDKEISDLNDKVTSLNSTIEANKLEMSAKDQEIARLKVFEQRWMLMSQAMAPVTQEVPNVKEETTKTI